jgi:tripartite-type tricarboxylate transporter receptor subunit TctC
MRKLIRTAIVSAALCGLTAFGAAAYAQAQTFTKPIRVIVPYTAGDLADTIARLLSPKLKDALGQPIVIENRPGASGLIGLQAALQDKTDGHTFVLGQMGSMAVAPTTNKLPFDVRAEFVPVAMAYTNYMALVANPTLPAKTLPQLIAYSKANPGKVRLATNGEGGFPHLAMELLRERAGLEFQHVPYKGSSQPLMDVVGGQVELTVAGFSTVFPYVKNGRLNAIALTGKSRAGVAPAIPTIGETVPGYDALGWFGFFAPKAMPAAAVTAFNEAVNAALKMPDIQQRADVLGLDTAAGTPAQFDAVWREDYEKWGKLIRTLKLDAK